MRYSSKADDSHFLHLKNFLANQNLGDEETKLVQDWRRPLPTRANKTWSHDGKSVLIYKALCGQAVSCRYVRAAKKIHIVLNSVSNFSRPTGPYFLDALRTAHAKRVSSWYTHLRSTCYWIFSTVSYSKNITFREL